MNDLDLHSVALTMVAPGKGLLAMDESNPTCAKRFDKLNIPCTPETRRDYRSLLVTTAGLSDHISGAILFDETLRQQLPDGTPFADYLARQGILPGIKVDARAKALAGFPGEKVTEGLDGLRERFEEYRGLGARFAKWRAVITVGPGLPTRGCIEANAHGLARYAALAQEAGLVPVVEPEVLIDGDHTIDQCYAATEETLHTVFNQLYHQRVALEGMILKASMVLSGKTCPQQAGVEEVAEKTVRCLLNTVPARVPGVAFLSGGQSALDATAHLNAMNAAHPDLPWTLTFSYARALQQPAMEAWAGNDANTQAAQKLLHHRAQLNGAAALGKYNKGME